MTTTISRAATRKIAAIREQATVCVVHSLRRDFVAYPCPPDFAWADLEKYHNARLWVNDAGDEWTIRIHGNLWYVLRAPTDTAPTTAATPEGAP